LVACEQASRSIQVPQEACSQATHLKLCPMQIRCNGQKKADWKYDFYTENFTARWRFQFRSYRSQTFGRSRNNFPASSTTLLFFFWMGFLEVKKMSSVTATRRWVKRPKQSPPKCLKGFCYLTGLRLEAKKLLTTDISNSAFISSSR